MFGQDSLLTFIGHKLAVTAVSFSPNGKILASGSADKSVKCWNLDSGNECAA
jgi:WD40 repeat protein